METVNLNQAFERSTLIKEAYEQKKGRETHGENPYTCYVNIDSPRPDLAWLTASLLDELTSKPMEGFLWTRAWDKSIVALNPKVRSGCYLLETGDLKGKGFLPITTTVSVELADLVALLPKGKTAVIGINKAAVTIDAFLICYFHLVNELLWDLTIAENDGGVVSARGYKKALDRVTSDGFEVVVMEDEELLDAKKKFPDTSFRIYGSMVNKNVPQILGAVIR